jgi:hypothetical protein
LPDIAMYRTRPSITTMLIVAKPWINLSVA